MNIPVKLMDNMAEFVSLKESPTPIPRHENGRATMPTNEEGMSGDYVAPQYTEEGRKLIKGAVVGGIQAQSQAATRLASWMSSRGERIRTDQYDGGPATPWKLSTGALVVATQPTTTKPKRAAKAKSSKVKKAAAQEEFVPVQVKADVDMAPNYGNVEPTPVITPAPTPQPQAGPTFGSLARPTNTVVFNTGLGKIRVNVEAILETDTGICLVFPSEDNASYIPEQGQELNIQLPDKREIAVMSLALNFNWATGTQYLMTFIKTDV